MFVSVFCPHFDGPIREVHGLSFDAKQDTDKILKGERKYAIYPLNLEGCPLSKSINRKYYEKVHANAISSDPVFSQCAGAAKLQ